MLTPRQRNQIKAALTFWNAVAETSRVHPMGHPKVRSFFEGDLTPLIAGEIDDLLSFFDEFEPHTLVTLRHIAQTRELSVARLRTQAIRDKIKSVHFENCPIDFYHPYDLIAAVRKIKERDAQMEQKYHAKTIHTPPPTDSDKSV